MNMSYYIKTSFSSVQKLVGFKNQTDRTNPPPFPFIIIITGLWLPANFFLALFEKEKKNWCLDDENNFKLGKKKEDGRKEGNIECKCSDCRRLLMWVATTVPEAFDVDDDG